VWFPIPNVVQWLILQWRTVYIRIKFIPEQWRRSVVIHGVGGQGQSGQAIKLFQITPYYDVQTFNNPGSMTACRRLEQSVLLSIFDTSLSSLMMWNLQSYPTTVLNERMWHFMGSKYTLTPRAYFQGSRPPTPSIYAPHPSPKRTFLLYWLRQSPAHLSVSPTWKDEARRKMQDRKITDQTREKNLLSHKNSYIDIIQKLQGWINHRTGRPRRLFAQSRG